MKRINLLIVEGVLIILLVLFSGFLAYQNQRLTKEIESLSKPTPTIVSTATPTPSSTPTATPSATPKATKTPKVVPTPGGSF